MNLRSLYVLLLAAACLPSSLTYLDSMKSWFYGSESGDGKFDTQSDGLKFEILSADDKFLQLKDVFEDMSPLDSCYYIVVYHLKKKCGELSEEELGKLSVQLLNCQSAAEERPVFACTQSMNGQYQLHAITTETVRKLYKSQSDLIGTQQELKLAQDDILGHIYTNMKELVREKALITTGNKELADMTENIREKS